MRAAALVGLACVGVAVGLLAEHEAFDWSDLRGWLPDLLAGWTLLAVGLALAALRRSSRAAALLLIAGFTWFAFHFAATSPDAVQSLAARSAYLHRGALFTLALTLPAGRPRNGMALAGVGLAWVAAIVWPLWDTDVTALILVTVLLAIAVNLRWTAAGWRERATASLGLAGVALLSAAIAADAVRSIVGVSQGVTDGTVLGYATAVAAAGILLFAGVLLHAPASLAERAVALERGGTSLRDALRDLLGDPQLAIAFGSGDNTQAGDGASFARTAADGRTTPVEISGQRVGVISHGPTTLDDPATRAAVLATVGLVAERARLRAEVGRQIEDVEASRRRLLLAEEEERRRLAGRLDRGPGAALAEVEQLVRLTRTTDGGSAQLAAALDRASEQLARVRPEIDSLVRGLSVADERELHVALRQLVADLPLTVELDIVDTPLTAEVSSALWFVCAEAVSNAVKHASARTVRVSLSATDGDVRLAIIDDGRGGADRRGSGLVGLADRLAALGGRLRVESPSGVGTTVVAEVPLSPVG
jgi:signal transduction histidine kinase